MPKSAQTTTQLSLFHVPERECSKSFKLGFSSTWTKNIQVYNMDLEKTEESEIKLPSSIRWLIEKAREFQKNIYFGFIDYTKDFV